MTNIDMVLEKVEQVKGYLRMLERNCQFSLEDIQTKESAKLITERCLFLLAQSVIDLVDVLIICKKFRRPSSARDSFDVLFRENVISFETTENMQSFVGFRNLLSHEYSTMDYTKVYEVLQKVPKHVKQLLEDIDKLNI